MTYVLILESKIIKIQTKPKQDFGISMPSRKLVIALSSLQLLWGILAIVLEVCNIFLARSIAAELYKWIQVGI